MKKVSIGLTIFAVIVITVFFQNRLVKSDLVHEHNQFHSDTIDETSITVLNWNIHKEVEDSLWIFDFTSLIQQYSPDIITLQEAQKHHNIDRALGNRGYVFAANIENSDGVGAGVLTASGAKPSHFKTRHTTDYEPFLQTPKISLSTKYQLKPSNEILQVINVHGINFVSMKKFVKQMVSIEEAIKAHAGPVVLIGDFNTWKSERMDALLEITSRQNLNQVSFSPEDSVHIKHFVNAPLDHIFYSDELLLLEDTPAVLGQVESSDHKPLLATFALKS